MRRNIEGLLFFVLYGVELPEAGVLLVCVVLRLN
jgi:hypothetical protein